MGNTPKKTQQLPSSGSYRAGKGKWGKDKTP
jgi:hypothetical protein